MSPAASPQPSAATRIDRIALNVPTMSDAEAHRLAELVAEALGQTSIPMSATGRSTSLVVDQEPGSQVEELAHAIASQLREAFFMEGAR